MWWRVLFLMALVKPNLVYMDDITMEDHLDLLVCANSIMDDIKSEQKVMNQQITNNRWQLNEFTKSIKNDLEQLKEFKEIREDLEDIKETLKQLKSEKNHIDQSQLKVSCESTKDEQMQIAQNLIEIKQFLINITNDVKQIKVDFEQMKQDQQSCVKIENNCEPNTSIGNQNNQIYERNCANVVPPGKSGIYEIIIPNYSADPFKVVCEPDSDENGWTIILRRHDGSVNFDRDWAEYKEGFGDLSGEFWLGLNKIHALTHDQPNELLIIVNTAINSLRYTHYKLFKVGNENEFFELQDLGERKGFSSPYFPKSGTKFTTFDKDNDNSLFKNCGQYGAWWHDWCERYPPTGRLESLIFSEVTMLLRPRK